MQKIVSIIGARPQFIKAAALSRILLSVADVQEILVHTGQHYDLNMSGLFFSELDIPEPDYHLGIGSGSQGLQTGRMLGAVEEVLLRESPDWVVVYGDTNSTLAGALAAVKLHIPVAHVEAGLRSFNRRMPEEINRVLVDHMAELLFAPSLLAADNLKREGIPESRIHLVGDVMYDAALYYAAKSAKESSILSQLGLQPKSYILATIHRAHNTDTPACLRAIVEGLTAVSREIPVILPLHPRTLKAMQLEWSDGADLQAATLPCTIDRLNLIPPVGYLDMVMLEKNARLIATDSGGVQKEAFFNRVPCVTLRHETEWIELIQLGWNRLVPPKSKEAIIDGILSHLNSRGEEANPYGDGRAAQKMVECLRSYKKSQN